ncbi:MAG: LytTR family transcriptional regulator [Bacilli bacterium]|nr:LytTR family transcriptional regulator [Bacilli bacterium]
MINFVICSSSNSYLHLYKEIIHKLMNDKKTDYRIHAINSFSFDNIKGRKIFIFDFIDEDNVKFIKELRLSKDNYSPIICIFDNNVFSDNELLWFKKNYSVDVIFRKDNIYELLSIYLNINYNIVNRNKSLCFKYCNELFHILYNDIYYIEKNLCNNDSTIVTKDCKYIINLSINKIMNILDNDNRFYKCHRSCIVNIDNIVSYDISNNIIKFYNDTIALVSRNRKRELENKIIDRNYVN